MSENKKNESINVKVARVNSVEEAMALINEIVGKQGKRKKVLREPNDPPSADKLAWATQPKELVGVPVVAFWMGVLTAKSPGVPMEKALFEIRGIPGDVYYLTYGNEFDSVTLVAPSAHDAFIMLGALAGEAFGFTGVLAETYEILENTEV